MLIPAENAAEAAVVDGLSVIPIQNHREAAQFLEGEIRITPSINRSTMMWILPTSKVRNQ